APAFLRAGHGAGIRLMVHAEEVQYTVQHQDANFVFDRVSEFPGLRAGAAEGDCQIAERIGSGPGKGQDVGSIVLLAELAIQAAQFGIAGDEHVEAAAAGDFRLELSGEEGEAPLAQRLRDAPEYHSTAVGRIHGGAQACGAVSVTGTAGADWGGAAGLAAASSCGSPPRLKASWRLAPMVSLYCSYALTIRCTRLWRTTSLSSKRTKLMPCTPFKTSMASSRPLRRAFGRSIWVT